MTLPAAAPHPSPGAERRALYERYALVFSRVHAETHSIAVALEVLDAVRARDAALPPPVCAAPSRILTIVASLFCISGARLRSRDRHTQVVAARHVAAWLLRRRHWSTGAIGALLGIDHSTVIYGLRKVDSSERLRVAGLQAERMLVAIRDTHSFSELPELPSEVCE